MLRDCRRCNDWTRCILHFDKKNSSTSTVSTQTGESYFLSLKCLKWSFSLCSCAFNQCFLKNWRVILEICHIQAAICFVIADKPLISGVYHHFGALYGVRKLWASPPDRPRTSAQNSPLEMDSIMSLGGPLKQFTSCVTGGNAATKRGGKRSESVRRSSFTRRRSISRRRSLPCGSQKVPDSWLRVYQAELKKERWAGAQLLIHGRKKQIVHTKASAACRKFLCKLLQTCLVFMQF